MGPPRILITGGAGQLARALSMLLGAGTVRDRVYTPPEAEADITDRAAVRAALAAHRPDWVINCAAFTAVDAAEQDPERVYRVNDAAVGILADEVHEHGARLLHLSTDYVFDGEKDGPYVEEDPPNPLNVYGASKLAGERRLLSHPVRSAILRTAWLYGERGKSFFTWAIEIGRKAVKTGEPMRVVADQEGSPTDVHTLAVQIEAAIDAGLEGLYHAAAEGSASWYEFAREIFAGLGLAPPMRAVRGEELGRPARRPPRAILENRRLKALGRHRMMDWKEGLRGVIGRLKNLS